MKKYKLKKWYPSLPNWVEKGFIAYGSTDKYGIIQFKSNPCKSHVLPAYEVENNPEFWEEVKKDDYKILEIRYKKSYCIIKIASNNEFTGGCWSDLWEIYSVERLSDGEVFAIGDKVNSEWFPSTATIQEIEEEDIGLVIRTSAGPFSIDSIEKEHPLFTTEDGVGIYEGDEYYYIDVVSKTKKTYTADEYSFKDKLYSNWKGPFAKKRTFKKWKKENSHLHSIKNIENALEKAKVANLYAGNIYTINKQKLFEVLQNAT